MKDFSIERDNDSKSMYKNKAKCPLSERPLSFPLQLGSTTPSIKIGGRAFFAITPYQSLLQVGTPWRHLTSEQGWSRYGVCRRLVRIVSDSRIAATVHTRDGHLASWSSACSTASDLDLMTRGVELGAGIGVCCVEGDDLVADNI